MVRQLQIVDVKILSAQNMPYSKHTHNSSSTSYEEKGVNLVLPL